MGASFERNSALSAVRESRGVSLQQIAGSTKINLFYLKAIESGEVDKLPGSFYARSYIRQYARAIDYCEEDLLELCGISIIDEEEPELPLTRGERILLAFRAFTLNLLGTKQIG
jgi:cytoskeletal protein RodZ